MCFEYPPKWFKRCLIAAETVSQNPRRLNKKKIKENCVCVCVGGGGGGVGGGLSVYVRGGWGGGWGGGPERLHSLSRLTDEALIF